jgi:hypothetical protein
MRPPANPVLDARIQPAKARFPDSRAPILGAVNRGDFLDGLQARGTAGAGAGAHWRLAPANQHRAPPR